MKTPFGFLFISAFCLLTQSASAGLILSFRSSDLLVPSNGGTVVKSIDLLLTYDGTGNNLISAYDLKITVPAPDVTIVTQAVTSELQFAGAHALLGSDSDYLLVGTNDGVDNSLVANVSYRLATLDFTINTASAPSSFAIQASMDSAIRGANAGIDIVSDFTFQPANIIVTSVPEPSSWMLVALASSAIAIRRRSKE